MIKYTDKNPVTHKYEFSVSLFSDHLFDLQEKHRVWQEALKNWRFENSLMNKLTINTVRFMKLAATVWSQKKVTRPFVKTNR